MPRQWNSWSPRFPRAEGVPALRMLRRPWVLGVVAAGLFAAAWVLPASSAPSGAPGNVKVAAGNGSVTVSFTRPSVRSGVRITNYAASFSRDNGRTWSAWRSAKPADAVAPVTFTGLTNGVRWKLRLRTVTNVGAGPASAVSASFVPRATTVDPPPPTTRPTTTTTTSPSSTSPPGAGVERFVSPTGNDAAAGTRAAPLRTLAEAWARIPRDVALTQPHTITLLAGDYPASTMPHYWEWRVGTATAPITIRSDTPGRPVTLRGDLNLFEVHHLTVRGVKVAPGGDAVHCERCSFLTLDDVELDGRGSGGGGAWETLKVNQSSDIVVRNSTLHAAGDNVIDFVAVQRGTIEHNTITDGGDWCMYVKGGSTGITVNDNEISRCGTGGFTAGQGTGLEFMVEPYLTYEATDVVFRDNHITDVEGAAFGVNGGRNILIEGNRAERVGRRSHLIEVTFGGRSCDGNAARCAALLAKGAWGTSVTGGAVSAHIPDRDVIIRNNTIVNPAGYRSQWQHFEISTPRTNTGSAIGPSPARSDDGLVITGNVIVNGDASMELGIDGVDVCAPTNPTCTVAQIYRDNDINGR